MLPPSRPSARPLLPWGLLALAPLALGGCQATASARLSGQTSMQASPGGASAATGGSAKVTASASATLHTPSIRFVQGHLDYQGTIQFAYDQARLEGEETGRVLEEFRDFLRKHPAVKVRIEGHTDSRGSEDHNKQLSRRRAESIRRWLIEHGIEEKRLEAVGLGEDGASTHEAPECLNKTPGDTSRCEPMWALSRRAVFSVTAGAETIPREEPRREEKDDEEDSPEPPSTPDAPQPPRLSRRWYLGGHLGTAAQQPPEGSQAQKNFAFFGPDLGLWLTPRLSLGLSGDLAPGPSGSVLGRGLFFLEWHASSGPGPEFWVGGGLGAGTLPYSLDPASGALALRLGLDFHTSRATRLGFFLEGASRMENASWGGIGIRLQRDFFSSSSTP